MCRDYFAISFPQMVCFELFGSSCGYNDGCSSVSELRDYICHCWGHQGCWSPSNIISPCGSTRHFTFILVFSVSIRWTSGWNKPYFISVTLVCGLWQKLSHFYEGFLTRARWTRNLSNGGNLCIFASFTFSNAIYVVLPVYLTWFACAHHGITMAAFSSEY